jgi:PiT family inorganic phosphate transporter
MLILVGAVPTAYALNRAMPADHVAAFVQVAEAAKKSLSADAHHMKDVVLTSLATIIGETGEQVRQNGSLARFPTEAVANVRNDMYLAAETIRYVAKDKSVLLSAKTHADLAAYRAETDVATKFIPLWVKVVVAIALGLGTMVGWKRIVVTVGEKIGKTHMNYAQGASAAFVAMATIGAADAFGLPVSTTHVLSSGIAGTMAGNGSGVRWLTIRNLATTWVLTLPAAIILSGSLYWLFSQLI